MKDAQQEISVAIETSCSVGGAVLGIGDAPAEVVEFDASSRHAVHLIFRLEQLLSSRGLQPRDVDHVYVSAGPGSFTGLRLGITAARTLGQFVPGLKCVAVPTAWAVAENVRALQWRHLGVVLDAKDELVCAALFERQAGEAVLSHGPELLSVEEFLAQAPRPLLLNGEALRHQEVSADGVELAGPELHLPKPESVWRVGRRLAAAGQFTEYAKLLPIYARGPEAVRLWEKRHGKPSA